MWPRESTARAKSSVGIVLTDGGPDRGTEPNGISCKDSNKSDPRAYLQPQEHRWATSTGGLPSQQHSVYTKRCYVGCSLIGIARVALFRLCAGGGAANLCSVHQREELEPPVLCKNQDKNLNRLTSAKVRVGWPCKIKPCITRGYRVEGVRRVHMFRSAAGGLVQSRGSPQQHIKLHNSAIWAPMSAKNHGCNANTDTS